jgi:hypothetical protein
MTLTPIARVSNWLGSREYLVRPCGLNRAHGGATGEQCDNEITLSESKTAGHRGYCSHEHALQDQIDAPM